MKTATVNVFKFEELSNEVKDKLIESYREQLEYFDDGVIEDLTHFLIAIGFDKDVEIEYSLDYSHYPFAKVIGQFNKKDLTEARNNYRGDNVIEIFDLIDNLEVDCFEVDGSNDYFEEFCDLDATMLKNLMGKINAFLYAVIENDFANYFADDSILDNIISLDLDYMADGSFFNMSNDLSSI